MYNVKFVIVVRIFFCLKYFIYFIIKIIFLLSLLVYVSVFLIINFKIEFKKVK